MLSSRVPVRALAAALLAVPLLACTAAPDDTGPIDETEDLAEGLAEAGHLQVVQYNPFYGGAYPRYAYQEEGWQSLPKTYETAETFAAMLTAKYPAASVIGMQEILSEENAEQIRLRLAQASGKPWMVQFYGKSIADGADALPSTKEAIFWRDDVVTMLESFGTRQVQRYKNKSGTVISVRFGGALLQKKGTSRRFGFFTGKLTPRSQKGLDGKVLGDDDKVEELGILDGWIEQKMSAHPKASRIVAIDMNAGYGTDPWHRMAQSFADSHDPTKTWKSPHTGNWYRYDYIWWDYDGAAKTKKNGFFEDPHVMGKTGSDHKAVIADVYVRAPG